MFARCLILMCFICCATGCTSLQEKFSIQWKEPEQLLEPKQLHPTEQIRPVPSFTQVYIQGKYSP